MLQCQSPMAQRVCQPALRPFSKETYCIIGSEFRMNRGRPSTSFFTFFCTIFHFRCPIRENTAGLRPKPVSRRGAESAEKDHFLFKFRSWDCLLFNALPYSCMPLIFNNLRTESKIPLCALCASARAMFFLIQAGR